MARYPDAPRADTVEVLHGESVADPYRWLEDLDDVRTKEWLAAQDELCRSTLDALPARPWFGRTIESLMPGALSGPSVRADRCVFVRREVGQDHGVLHLRDASGAERVLVDPNALSDDGTTTLDAYHWSIEGDRLAYQLSEGGTEESALRVLDVSSGETIDGPIDRCRYSPVAWEPGGDAFFYMRYLSVEEAPDDEPHLHRRVYRHVIGQDPELDELVAGEGTERGTYWGIDLSHDGRWLVLSSSVGTAPRNDVWIHDRRRGGRIHAVITGADASTAARVLPDGHLWIATNLDAPNWRVAMTTPEMPEPAEWIDVIPEDPHAVLESFVLLDDRLVVSWLRDVAAEVTVHRLNGRQERSIALPGKGLVGLHADPQGGDRLWISYADFVTPTVVVEHVLISNTTTEWGRAPGSVDLGAVTSRQVFVESNDGTRIPAFVIEPAAHDASPRPTILYGYGGFGVTMGPAYAASIAAWVKAGGVYVVANLRGGGEYGETWHRAGMRAAKQNVFDDFHAVARWLCEQKITTTDQLAISGGSNGGLLVGAALTQWPDQFAAVVCSAPLLDMIRYERFGLGETWNDEYGRADDPTEFGWLQSYSPYHRVTAGTPYPAVLFTLFDSDTRVDPLHGRKMCAALQWATTSAIEARPILLRREADAGHAASGITKDIALRADTAAFLAHHTGLVPPP